MFWPNVLTKCYTLQFLLNSSASHFFCFLWIPDCIFVIIKTFFKPNIPLFNRLFDFFGQILHLQTVYHKRNIITSFSIFTNFLRTFYELFSHSFSTFLQFSVLLLPLFQTNTTLFSHPSNLRTSHFFSILVDLTFFLRAFITFFSQILHFLTLNSTFSVKFLTLQPYIKFEKLSYHSLFFSHHFRTHFALFTIFRTVVTSFSNEYHTLQFHQIWQHRLFFLEIRRSPFSSCIY